MEKISKEQRKLYNKHVERHNEQMAAQRSAAGVLSFVFVLIGGFIAYNTKEPFFHYIAWGCFGLALVFGLIGKYAGSGTDNFHKHHH